MKSLKDKIKLLISIITIVFCICIPNFSSAKTLTPEEVKKGPNEGASIVLNLGSLRTRNDLFCIQWNSHLGYENTTYRIDKYVKIIGNIAQDQNGQKSINTANGTLAYIVSEGQKTHKNANVGVSVYPSQKAMWSYINNWFSVSGKKLGVDLSYSSNSKWAQNEVVTAGKNYAKSIGNSEKVETKNNTDKSKINVKQYDNDGISYMRIGPFKYTFPGNITSLNAKDQDGKNIKDMRISVIEGKKEKFISTKEIQSGKNFYISVKSDAGVSKISKLEGKVTMDNPVLSAELWFLQSLANQNLLLVNADKSNIETEFEFNDDYEIDLTGTIGIIKVDEDNNKVALEGVEFIVQNKDTGEYIIQKDKQIQYNKNKDKATHFKTDKEGKIVIEKVLLGKYAFYELSNPHYGYEIKSEPTEITAQAKLKTYQKITNRQKYIKISGYVWEDIQSQKMSVRNDLYKDNEDDSEDVRKEGIIVRLKDKTDNTGTPLKETTTDSNGTYLFENIEIDKLENYYIEFEYDGLIYQNVAVNLGKENGSKSSEGSNRDAFNNMFARIEGKSKDTVQVKDNSGKEVYDVKYTLHPEEATAEISEENCTILANTLNAGLTLTYTRGSGVTEINNINLGIYKREQADFALMQDVDQVKVSVKGENHIYKYASRFQENEPVEDAWNVGVKFKNKYGSQTYLRPIYRADAEYNDENDKENNNLKVLLTYKIGLRNETSHTTKVNNITDYYDSRYTIKNIGTQIDEKGDIKELLENPNENDIEKVDKYNKVDIKTDMVMKKGEIKYIYIQFELSRENILNLLNEAEKANNEITPNLENIAEITSYTTYADEDMTKFYAAVDKDSVADNITVGDKTTYEDDTEAAPNIGITIANARVMSGTVFEDNADENLLKEQNIRQGDGKFDSNNEHTVGGVKVQLVEVDDNGNITDKVAKLYDEKTDKWTEATFEQITGEDGKYSFSGFLPGKYAIRYTWGDGMYYVKDGNKQTYENPVENYKATIFEEKRYEQENSNPYYYQTAKGKNLTHATDDWLLRQKIDTQLNSHGAETNNGYNYSTKVTDRYMTSNTPIMKFKVEFNDTDLNEITYNSDTRKVTFEVSDIDFGIIRRPIQNIELNKRVSHINIAYPSGEVIINADITEDGKLTGQTEHLVYMKPTVTNGERVGGMLKAELDNEVMQNSVVTLTYQLTVRNSGEADYSSEQFYKFGNGYYTTRGGAGQTQKEKDIATISPSKIIDYLDKNSVFKSNDETNIKYGWKETSLEDLKTNELVATNVTEAATVLNGTKIYVTEYLKDAKLKPNRMVGNTFTNADKDSVYLVTEQRLSVSEDTNYINQAEIIEISKNYGSKITTTPGNYIPFNTSSYVLSQVAHEPDDWTAEDVIITNSTGADKNYIPMIAIGLTAFVIMAGGIYFIRKKVS